MTELYMVLIAAMISISVIRMILNPANLFDFPVFIGIVFAGVLGPQIMIVYEDNRHLPAESFEQFLFLSVNCLGMSWLGYIPRARVDWLLKFRYRINTARLTVVGWVLVALGLVSSYLMLTTEVELTDEGMATGVFTLIYFAFHNTIFPAYAIQLQLFLRRPSVLSAVGILMTIWCPIYMVLVLGRREHTIALGMITLGSLYWIRKFIPPRLILISAVMFVAMMVQVIGEYRTFVSERGVGAILEFDPFERFSTLEKKRTPAPEVSMACLRIDQANRLPDLNYGAGFWNAIVYRLIPAQIVGRDIKDFLLLPVNPPLFDKIWQYPVTSPPTTAPTAIADSYVEFGYLGCLYFGFLSYFFKCLRAACDLGYDIAILVFVIINTSARLSLSHVAVEIIPALIAYMVILGPVILVSSKSGNPI